jgi:hypothetical protein
LKKGAQVLGFKVVLSRELKVEVPG